MSKNRIEDLQIIISKMPLSMCCATVLPELGIKWRDLSRTVRNSRLPMTSTSIAKILTRHVAKSLSKGEIVEIVSRLRLKMVATQRRTWHVIKLSEQVIEEPMNVLLQMIPSRIEKAVTAAKLSRNKQTEIQSAKMGDLIYISVQLMTDMKDSGVFYIAHPPGEPVALVSSARSGLLRPCVLGLGYKKWEDACLHGRDVPSLLRIINGRDGELPDHLAAVPEYHSGPCLVRGGIDFTGRAAADRYAALSLGPDPPLLTKLSVTTQKEFFNPDILDAKMKITVEINSEDVGKTLHAWAVRGAIHPTSDLFRVFRQVKSNKVHVHTDDED